MGTSAATAAARDRSDRRGAPLHLQRKPPDTYKIVIGATGEALSAKKTRGIEKEQRRGGENRRTKDRLRFGA